MNIYYQKRIGLVILYFGGNFKIYSSIDRTLHFGNYFEKSLGYG